MTDVALLFYCSLILGTFCSDKEDLPSIDSLFGSSVQPIILEISDLGIPMPSLTIRPSMLIPVSILTELPESVTSVLRSHHVTAVGPSAQAVQQVLKEHGVQARVEAYKVCACV